MANYNNNYNNNSNESNTNNKNNSNASTSIVTTTTTTITTAATANHNKNNINLSLNEKKPNTLNETASFILNNSNSTDHCDMTSLEILNKCHLDLFPKKEMICDDDNSKSVIEQLPILNGEYIHFIGKKPIGDHFFIQRILVVFQRKSFSAKATLYAAPIEVVKLESRFVCDSN